MMVGMAAVYGFIVYLSIIIFKKNDFLKMKCLLVK